MDKNDFENGKFSSLFAIFTRCKKNPLKNFPQFFRKTFLKKKILKKKVALGQKMSLPYLFYKKKKKKILQKKKSFHRNY